MFISNIFALCYWSRTEHSIASMHYMQSSCKILSTKWSLFKKKWFLLLQKLHWIKRRFDKDLTRNKVKKGLCISNIFAVCYRSRTEHSMTSMNYMRSSCKILWTKFIFIQKWYSLHRKLHFIERKTEKDLSKNKVMRVCSFLIHLLFAIAAEQNTVWQEWTTCNLFVRYW